jgi:FKBP-type peptidyl-prolyl cis-trans isomerase FklB
VKTTASGLQYIVLQEGSGVSPTATDKVKAHYHGTLVDGTVFDSSKERGQPFETQVNRVVKGWIEGLQLMKPGASYRFFIHPDLAYGPRGQNKIPANSLLIFDLDLIEVISAPKKKPKIQAVTPPVAIPPLKKKDK